MRIPRAAVLSGKNCDPTMAQCLTTMHGTYGMDSQLCLALALYYEMLRGPSSLWHGYLQSLPPPKDSDLAVFWPNICVLLSDGTGTNKHCMIHKDAREAYRWARGTELLKYLQGPDGTNIVVSRLMQSHHETSDCDFCRRYSIDFMEELLYPFFAKWILPPDRHWPGSVTHTHLSRLVPSS